MCIDRCSLNKLSFQKQAWILSPAFSLWNISKLRDNITFLKTMSANATRRTARLDQAVTGDTDGNHRSDDT